MVALAIPWEELKVEWLSGGRSDQKDPGSWIYLALPKMIASGYV